MTGAPLPAEEGGRPNAMTCEATAKGIAQLVTRPASVVSSEEGGREPKWERITPENYARLRMVLVTNNPRERRANDGRMSHLWLAQAVFMEGATPEFTAFDEADRKLRGLTHYYEAPNADV